jgi:hypothetical protein
VSYVGFGGRIREREREAPLSSTLEFSTAGYGGRINERERERERDVQNLKENDGRKSGRQ